MTSKRWFKFAVLPLSILAVVLVISHAVFLRNSGIAAALALEDEVNADIERLCFPKTAEEADRIFNIPNEINAGDEMLELVLAESALGTGVSEVTVPSDKDLDEAVKNPTTYNFTKFSKNTQLQERMWQKLAPVLPMKRMRLPKNMYTNIGTDSRTERGLYGLGNFARIALMQALSDSLSDRSDKAELSLKRAHWLVKRLPDNIQNLGQEDELLVLRHRELSICKTALTNIASMPGGKFGKPLTVNPALKQQILEVVNDPPMRVQSQAAMKVTFFVGSELLKDLDPDNSLANTPSYQKSLKWIAHIPRVRDGWKLQFQWACLQAFGALNDKNIPEAERSYFAEERLRGLMLAKKDLSTAPWKDTINATRTRPTEVAELPKLEAEIKQISAKK